MVQEIMTSEQAAAYLQIGIVTLKKKAQTGRIPAAKIGRGWRFVKSELDEWLHYGGDMYERQVDKGIALAMEERIAANKGRKGKPLEQFLVERGR
ncbi:MAG: helix-turn-helix domain-containing protein [Armatimonadota bacterium]